MGELPTRLIFLHGFTQTHHHWHPCAFRIGAALGDPMLAFLDLPGHGLSGSDRTTIDDAAGPLADLAGRGTYVGYSMGGRFAIHAAIARPDAVERLVLIGATPGIEHADARDERRHLDEERADRVQQIGVSAFIDEWVSQPLFGSFPRQQAGIAARLRNTVDGLAWSLRTAGTGVQRSLWDELPTVTVPVLVLAGELDTKFAEIGRRMAEVLPHGTFGTIPDAGHAAHGEQPAATAELIAGWLG